MTGTVYLVGAGPGDPDLLTVGALRAIQRADVVLYDRLVGSGVLDLIPERSRRIPVGKTPGHQEETQRRILWLMAAHARRGRTVIRLKGGDPFIYGRGGEEWEHLVHNGIPVEVVPGISSALSVPALAGIPLTHRGISSSFAIVTGQRAGGPTDDWTPYTAVDTLVVLMGVTHRAEIARKLIVAGRAARQPTAFIQSGTTADEVVTVTTLSEVAYEPTDVKSPAVWVIGEVVALRHLLVSAEADTQPEPWLSPWRFG